LLKKNGMYLLDKKLEKEKYGICSRGMVNLLS
jgi:hypothetical protein